MYRLGRSKAPSQHSVHVSMSPPTQGGPGTAGFQAPLKQNSLPPPPPLEAAAPEMSVPPADRTLAMAIGEKQVEISQLPGGSPGTAALLLELGELQREAKQIDEARVCFEQALTASREAHEQPSTLIALNSLGLLLREAGRLDQARPLLEEAVETRRAGQGDRHPETLTSINNLASLLKACGALDAAAPLFAEALEVRRQVLGHGHLDTLTSINNLASLLRARDQQNDLQAAERLLAEGVGTSRRMLGEGHTTTRYFAANYKSVGVTNRNRRGEL